MIKFFFYTAFLLFAVQSCATFQPQYSKDYKEEKFMTDKKPVHTFFLLGDAGLGLVKDTVNRSNALVNHLKSNDYKLLDCQVYNEHLESLGCKEIPRKDFMKILKSE